jgi:hypothetical protein
MAEGHRSPPRGENTYELAEVATVRAVNSTMLKQVTRRAHSVARAWGVQKSAMIHELWRDLGQAEAELRRRLDEAGAFDCRAWAEAELLIWFVRLGIWPLDMGRTLDPAELGVAETGAAKIASDRACVRRRRDGTAVHGRTLSTNFVETAFQFDAFASET